MAVVGDAYIVVRALTNRVRDDIQNGFKGLGNVSFDAGRNAGNDFGDGFERGNKKKSFLGVTDAAAEAARQALNKLIMVGYAVAPALAFVAAAIGALGAGLVILTTVLGQALPALAVLPGLLSAIGFAAITAVIAFKGVGAALSAGAKAASSAADRTKALTAATKRLEQARVRLRILLEEEVPERLAQGRRAAADAADSAADSEISANRATRSYIEAQRRTIQALDKLSDAREKASERLKQLRFETEGGAISEKRARLQFERSRDALQRVQDLPPNSRARQEAELAFAESDLNLRKAIDRNASLKKEEEKSTKAGVEGSREVVAAKEEIERAVEREQDAQIDAAKSQRDLQKARESAIAAAAAAAAGGSIERNINRQITAAREAVKEAEQALADAGKSGGADKFREAMDKLSPAAQRFVEFLLSIKDAFKELSASAGENLFPKLEIAIGNLVTKLIPRLNPLLKTTGGILGDVAVRLSETITEAGNLESLENVWKNNDVVIESLGGTLSNFYVVLLKVIEAAGPLTEKFAKWIETITGNWATSATDDFDKLQNKLNAAGDVAARWGGIFGDIFSAFGNMGKAISSGGAADSLLTFFEEGAKKFDTFTGDKLDDGSLGKYFLDATTNAQALLSALTTIIADLLRLADNPGIKTTSDAIGRLSNRFREIADIILEEAGEEIAGFLDQLGTLLKNLAEGESFKNFFKTLKIILKFLNKIFGNEIVKKVFMFTAGIFAVTRAISLTLKIFKFFGKAILGNIKALGRLVGFAKDPFKSFRKTAQTTSTTVTTTGTAVTTTTTQIKTAGRVAATSGGGFRKLGGGLRAVGRGIRTVLGPMGLIFIAIEVLIPLIKKLYQENETFRNIVQAVFRFIKDGWENIVKPVFAALLDVVVSVWEALKDAFDAVFPAIVSAIDFAWNDVIKPVWEAIQSTFETVWEAIKTAFNATWNFIKDAIDFVWNRIIKPIFEAYATVYSTAWEVIKTAFNATWNFIKDAIDFVWNRIIKPIFEAYATVYSTAWDVIKTVFTTVWDFIKTNIKNVWNNIIKPIFRAFKTVFETVWDGIKIIFNTVWDGIKLSIEGIKIVFQTIWDAVETIISNAINNIKTVIEGISGVVTTVTDGLKTAFKTAFNFVADIWNNSIGKLSFTIPSWVPEIGGKGFSVPNIPRLAEGGVIRATPGGVLALIGEAGRSERVEPLDSQGLSSRDRAIIQTLAGTQNSQGPVINVYAAPGMNEQEIAEAVSRKLAFQMRRGVA